MNIDAIMQLRSEPRECCALRLHILLNVLCVVKCCRLVTETFRPDVDSSSNQRKEAEFYAFAVRAKSRLSA